MSLWVRSVHCQGEHQMHIMGACEGGGRRHHRQQGNSGALQPMPPPCAAPPLYCRTAATPVTTARIEQLRSLRRRQYLIPHGRVYVGGVVQLPEAGWAELLSLHRYLQHGLSHSWLGWHRDTSLWMHCHVAHGATPNACRSALHTTSKHLQPTPLSPPHEVRWEGRQAGRQAPGEGGSTMGHIHNSMCGMYWMVGHCLCRHG